MYIAFAERYQWTPDEVNALPADFVDEMAARWKAEAKHEERERAKAERKHRLKGR